MAADLITSTANPRLKAALRLRDRREREDRGLTLVDGEREVLRAIEAGATVEELWFAPNLCSSEACRAALAAVPVERHVAASEAVIGRLAYGERSAALVAVVRTPSTDLDRLDLPEDALIVVLDGIEKPGNVGAVLRSVDGAGGAALILADPRTDPFNPNVIRASLGTSFSVPVAAGTGPAVREWLRAHGLRVVAARVDGSVEYTAADLTGPLAIVLGSEASGLDDTWEGPDVAQVRLPMAGAADSLNVSVTAAVLLYEARRQRMVGCDRAGRRRQLPSEERAGWTSSTS